VPLPGDLNPRSPASGSARVTVSSAGTQFAGGRGTSASKDTHCQKAISEVGTPGRTRFPDHNQEILERTGPGQAVCIQPAVAAPKRGRGAGVRQCPIAERVQTLGGVAIGDPRHVAEITTIPRPPNGAEEVPAMLSRLLEAHEMILIDAHDAAARAAEMGDDGTTCWSPT
jgi:Ferritin-like domain